MNLNTEDPLKIQVKLAEDPIKIQIHMPETPVIRIESGSGPQGPKGDDYVLTEEDKDNIAELAADKMDLSDYAKKTEVPIESGTGIGSAKTKDFEYNEKIYSNEASGVASKAEGISTIASGANSHAEGNSTVASGGNAHSEGAGTTASGNNAHSEGAETTASGTRSHAEGTLTVAYGIASHAEGQETHAEGTSSHAEGSGTIANANSSHVSGTYNVEDNWNLWPEWISGTSYAVGDKVKYVYRNNLRGFICKTANSDTSFSVKKWTPDTSRDFVDIIGNGTADDSRSNAYALTWTGDGKYAGDVYVHSNPDSSGGNKLATENYVDDAVSHISSMTIHICTAQEYDAQTGIPTIANPDATTFYLVPGGDAPNLYIEWIYTNNAWEQFGSATIDLSEYVRKTDYASASAAGVVKISGAMGVDMINGFLTMATADHAYIQDGAHARKAIPPKFQHEAAFYGLAKAAGDTTQSQSSNPVGTYTPEAKAAIQQMLDVPSKTDITSVPIQDVQVNGVSVVNEGIANVPYANANILGVVQTEAEYGITVMAGTQGKLRVQQASANQVRAGQHAYKPIVPANQHAAVFYGLAAAAGDITQSQSANAVGSYTDEAKIAVRTMLGLDDLSILAIVENGLPAAEEVAW